MALDDGRVVSTQVLAALLGSLDRWLDGRRRAPGLAASATRCRGRRSLAWGGGSGTAAGIDDSGALLVDTDDGQVALQAGEVHLSSDVGV